MILMDENSGSAATVEYVFQVLLAMYGQAWERSLGNAPPSDVKTVWVNALDDVSHSKAARKSIKWALNNLPDNPPNARSFLALCRQAPEAKVLALPEPKADPERVAAALAKLAPIRTATPANPHGMKAWAYRLKARHDAGGKLNLYQINCYQAAIGAQA